MKRWFIFGLIALGIFVVFDKMQTRLKHRAPLHEITVDVAKLPEYSFKWRTCLYKYPDIQDHGKAHRCVREDI